MTHGSGKGAHCLHEFWPRGIGCGSYFGRGRVRRLLSGRSEPRWWREGVGGRGAGSGSSLMAASTAPGSALVSMHLGVLTDSSRDNGNAVLRISKRRRRY